MNNCARCGVEFDGIASQKYCGDLCREIAGVERKLGESILLAEEVEHQESKCDRSCCVNAKKLIKPSKWGFRLMKEVGKAAFSAVEVKYCPWCGGKLVG